MNMETMFVLMMVMIAGAYMMAAGSVVLVTTYTFLSNAIEARATVYASNVYHSGKVFRYRTRDNRDIELPAMQGTLHYGIGDEVPILYHARKPKLAFIKRDRPNWWGWPLVTVMAGCAFALAGLAGMVGRVHIS